MSLTQDQKHFTISEVAADWHELIVLQHITQPSVACANEQLIPDVASRHTTATIFHTWPSPLAGKVPISYPIESRNLSWFEHTVG